MAGRPVTGRPAPPVFDRIAVRRVFARAGDGDPEFEEVVRAARDSLLERLDVIRIAPCRILDLGAGTGTAARELARRYPSADVVSLDPVAGLLGRARSRAPRWFSKHRYVAAEAERLPLSSGSMDLIVSNLAMPWFDPPGAALAECLRTLRPGGLFLLSTLGPGTLREFAGAWPIRDDMRHMPSFADMHVLGDAMFHAGFADVVMDVQRARFRIFDFWRLCRVLSRSAGSGVLAARRHGLSGPAVFRIAAERYESLRPPGGSLPVSVEFVFGHAWAPEPVRLPSTGVVPRMDWHRGIGPP